MKWVKLLGFVNVVLSFMLFFSIFNTLPSIDANHKKYGWRYTKVSYVIGFTEAQTEVIDIGNEYAKCLFVAVMALIILISGTILISAKEVGV